jgi:hypothetical protein
VPQQDQMTEAAPPTDRSATNAPPLNAPGPAPGKSRADAGAALDSLSPRVDEARSSLQAQKKLNSLPDGSKIQPPAIPPPPPAPPTAQAAMEVPAAPQPEAKAASNTASAGAARAETNANAIGPPRDKQATTVQGEAAAVNGGTARQTISPEGRSSAGNERAFAMFRPVQNYSALLKAPSGSALWRAGKGGIIERSADAGKTWVSQMSPSQDDWLAGVAVSDAVCWLAGRNGAIARTVNGEQWERIAPPAQAVGTDGKLPDWSAIAARDGQSATITASDGRHFATPDGGKTWQAQ